VAWGPLAGYFAAKQNPPLSVVPLPASDAPPGQPLSFEIAIGVRRGQLALLRDLDGALERRASEVASLLDQYRVPRL
jgi:mxaJ protein